ncbi:MAG: carboxymuconolactone decarboxylase family protein [Methanotrichaceae archaeon]
MSEKYDGIVKKLGEGMGGYVPDTLKAIRKHNPQMVELIREMDTVMQEDGALDKKTKRLIAMACVTTRMCEDCVYPQAKVAMNYGATKEEILETLMVCAITGGVPTFSIAKKAVAELFKE